MPRGWLVLGLALAVLAGLWFTLFELGPPQEVENVTLYSVADPHLAARRFLRRMGVEAQTVRRQLEPESLSAIAGGTVVALDVQRSALGLMDQRFGDWVAAGGHLVVALASPWESWEQFELEADLPQSDRDEGAMSLPQAWQGGVFADGLGLRPAGVDDIGLRTVYWSRAAPGHDDAYVVDTHAGWIVEAAGVWESGGSCAARRSVGAGQVTVLCDGGFVHNIDFADHDHAALLWSLVNERVPTGTRPAPVWLVSAADYFGPWEWLWRHMPYGVVAGVVSLVVWIWMVSRRFGPVVETEFGSRRSVLEQVDAAAGYLWRRGAQAALLEPLLDEVEVGLARHVPGLRTLAGPERDAVLTRLLGDSGLEVGALLDGRGVGEPRRVQSQAFVRSVRILEQARRKL